MIRFFRSLRQRLLTENKFSRYLLYAVGEILLVVIGILIALQVNNWNEERKELKKEKELLSNVLEHVKSDSLSIANILSRTARIIRTHQALILLSKNLTDTTEVENLDWIRSSEPNVLIAKKNNPTLPNQVKDTALKNTLLDYFLGVEWLEFAISNHNDIIEQQVRPFLADKKLLNYGNQLQAVTSRDMLIDRAKFYNEFRNEEVRQILFESGIKLRILVSNAEKTREKNARLKNAILSYLETK